MFGTRIALGSGFVGSIREAKSPKTRTSKIGGKKVTEKKGKLSKDLGKPAMKATQAELDSYVSGAKTGSEKKKRVARVNLMKAHKKGHKAQGHKMPVPQSGIRSESIIRPSQTLAVIKPKYR